MSFLTRVPLPLRATRGAAAAARTMTRRAVAGVPSARVTAKYYKGKGGGGIYVRD